MQKLMALLGFVVCLQVNEYYNNTPCKGKSIHYQRFCPYRALCFGCITPRAFLLRQAAEPSGPGLGASALSGRTTCDF